MPRTKDADGMCDPGESPCDLGPGSGCRMEAVLGVDERGQMVLPKDVREKAGIRTGDKLALISWERDGRICCLALVKADHLNRMVRNVIGPLMEGEREE
jgi:antitoxin PrlF